MSEHRATILWVRKDEGFLQSKYSRNHTWAFDGGAHVEATAAPSVIPPPWTDPAFIDPEEAYIAALSSCHMLTFLHVAAKAGFVVDRYEDEAVGAMAKNEKGIPWLKTVTLRPRIAYGGDKAPTPEESGQLHHKAHDFCFIANSVKTEILIEPVA
ncbi:MAG: OsmC family protein [Candidatus Methylacidiphilales bacterium]|nr:OsmC family protein [Candidatus Methylacidiphilales bacterium]